MNFLEKNPKYLLLAGSAFYIGSWGYRKCYVGYFKSISRGTAILFNNNIDFKVLESRFAKGGKYVAVKALINEVSYAIISMYVPNKDSPEFFEQKVEIVRAFDSEEIRLC